MRRTAWRCLGVVSLAGWLAACGGAADPDTSTLERVREAGVVRVGYANEAPFAYQETTTGRLTGEAPEVARAILERMSVERIKGVLTEFGSLIPGLQAGRFDMIAAGMYITPQRCAEIAFSNPTYSVGGAFIVRAGNPLNLHSYEGLRDTPGATIGVVSGAVERGYARAVGIPDGRIIAFPDAPSAMAGVRTGRVSAYAATGLTVQNLLSKDSEGLQRAAPFTAPVIEGETVRGYGAFGFRQEDRHLLAEFNRHLADFIGTPEHLEIVEPFGFSTAQLPDAVTAQELCEGR